MPKTFLDLCQQLVEDAGIAGTITSVSGQTGEFLRVVNWIKRSVTEIDGLWFNWNYLHKVHTFTTVMGVRDYPPPADHNLWDKKTFKRVNDESNLVELAYSKHKLDPSLPTQSTPSIYTILPNQAIRFIDVPDDAYDISAEYWIKSPALNANADEPLMPEQFRDIIVYKALQYYANYESADEVKVQALENFKLRLDQLQSRELPDFKSASNLQSGTDIQVTVPYDGLSPY